MDNLKKCNEGEMGSGDSDDEFYNVKLPCTPLSATGKPVEKLEVKKVYSPSRTKVQYDYKFESSSDDEYENGNRKDSGRVTAPTPTAGDLRDSSESDKSDPAKDRVSLSQNTCKVVEKINEELKSMKNVCGKPGTERADNLTGNHITSMQTTGNVQRSQIGVVPPVVVVPPPMVVPQTSVMNMGPMLVPTAVGMGGQNLLPRHMVGMAGSMLGGPAQMGGLMPNPNGTLPSGIVGMNAVQGQIAGMMGMHGNLIGLPANAITGQSNIMGLQAGMINSAVGGMNVSMQGNMMGSGMIHMQRPGGGVMGVQGSTNMMGISRPGSNLLGMTRPMGVAGTGSTMLGLQTPGMTNPAGMMVAPGNVLGNAVVSNPAGLVVMGGVMGGMQNSNAVGTQANMIPNPGNVMVNNSMVRVVGAPQGNPPVRPVPPPPFLNLRNRSPAPGNFKWQGNARGPTTAAGSGPLDPSPASSPTDRGSSSQYDGDELSRDEKERSLSDRSSAVETDESQSPPPREVPNTFKNDGSFMELFKRMKDEKNLEASSVDQAGATTEATAAVKKPHVMLSGIVGKRRGGRVLKTGLVKKVKKDGGAEEEKHPKDAWSMYMAEVKKYREASCEEEGKTRPLVK